VTWNSPFDHPSYKPKPKKKAKAKKKRAKKVAKKKAKKRTAKKAKKKAPKKAPKKAAKKKAKKRAKKIKPGKLAGVRLHCVKERGREVAYPVPGQGYDARKAVRIARGLRTAGCELLVDDLRDEGSYYRPLGEVRTYRGALRGHANPIPEEGDRIELIEMPDDPYPYPPGSTGTVKWVKLVNLGGGMLGGTTEGGFFQVGVDWDHGGGLMLSIPPDRIRILPKGSL
jgi:hypothetical protein